MAAALLALPAAELVLRAGERLSCLGTPRLEPGFDLYAVGESTAVGEPYSRDGFSLAALVSSRFDGRLRGLPIRLVHLARGGQSIYPQAVALEKELRCRDRSRPGAALIYSGHNDAGLARGWSALMAWERAGLPRSRVLERTVYALEERVPALRARGPEHWLFHLRRALRTCRAAGVTPVLATPVSDPRADPGLQEPGTEAAELAPLGEQPCAALEQLSAGAGPWTRPYLVWRRGRCAEAGGRAAEAAALYKEAADASISPSFGRTSSAQLKALRALAAEEGVALADVEAAFEGKPRLFADVQHPSMDGYLILADAYARALGEPGPGPGDAEAVFARFGCDAACRAKALEQAGWFFLAAAADHAAPRENLAAARRRFSEALSLDRELYGARVGRALAERPDLLAGRESRERLGRLQMFFGRYGELSSDERAELAALLGREP